MSVAHGLKNLIQRWNSIFGIQETNKNTYYVLNALY